MLFAETGKNPKEFKNPRLSPASIYNTHEVLPHYYGSASASVWLSYFVLKRILRENHDFPYPPLCIPKLNKEETEKVREIGR